jgi:hypothetical protein
MTPLIPPQRTGDADRTERAMRSALVRAGHARRRAANCERQARIRPSVAVLYAGEARRLRLAATRWELDVRLAAS